MKLGAEPKKIAILGGLVLVAVYLLYSNFASSPAASSSTRSRPVATGSPAPIVTPAPEAATPARTTVARGGQPRRSEQEFRFSFKHKGVDPSTIDPKLRLDLLDKVRSVDAGPATRNLFAWGAAPAAALPPGVRDPGPIIPKPQQSIQAVNASSGPPPAPPPPPITLKYYGYTSQRADGHKRAFFSEGDCTPNAAPTAQCDIFVAAEGDLIMKRYKVVRIGVSSAEVEDTQFNHSQPLPITQESPG